MKVAIAINIYQLGTCFKSEPLSLLAYCPMVQLVDFILLSKNKEYDPTRFFSGKLNITML